ncbi:hypothetical protein GO755_33370 [Spirosoma sp. HMF4905]|uniref:Rhamnogalacturonase A/B/Epimerase-like pectate lyase domain-containing protein n=1 Tax=Spirosoma arboris TaxID=2682092 RepID=A0A7K1SMY5_9BACT|nr:right-handed parallel beta-helix repeat-containing protein [Spirosoma arboris]MVM34966.1 hypothetical protein [Spirosoma arboris]
MKEKQLENRLILADVSQLASYSDAPNRLAVGGKLLKYGPSITDVVDNVFFFPATGKGPGRWMLDHQGELNAREHGKATGDGQTDDTVALQQLINFACKANNPSEFGAFSPANGHSNTVYIPHGTYLVTDELIVPGSVTIRMDRATAYGGTRIIQQMEGKHLFHIKKDTDGTSSGVFFWGGILIQGSSVQHPEIALIYAGDDDAQGDANNQSTYIEGVWFRTPENYAINIRRGGDIKILDCTFDVIPFNAIKLGTLTTRLTHALIRGCTFFQVALNCIQVLGVEGLVIADNNVWDNDGNNLSTTFIDAGDGSIQGLTVVGNTTRNVPLFCRLSTSARGVTITGNGCFRQTHQLVQLTGGGVLYGAVINSNSVFFPGQALAPGIDATGCGLQNSTLIGNSFFAETLTTDYPAMRLNDNRIINNQIGYNASLNFSQTSQLHLPQANGSLFPESAQAGDLLLHDGTTWTLLPKGTNGQFLKMVAGLPAWSN